jgi:hypothetical protein
VLRGAPPQHAAPTVFAVTASLVRCCGNYRGICANKKKVKKELNAGRRFEYSSDQGEQIYEQSPTSGVRFVSQECGSAGDLFRHCI